LFYLNTKHAAETQRYPRYEAAASAFEWPLIVIRAVFAMDDLEAVGGLEMRVE
jgi:hypothetical protein